MKRMKTHETHETHHHETHETHETHDHVHTTRIPRGGSPRSAPPRLARLSPLNLQEMDAMEALFELKDTMPSETYLQLCNVLKRVREDEVPLFKVKYVVNTIIGSLYMPGEEDEGARCEEVSAMHTKIMSGKKFRGWGYAKEDFIDGHLMLDEENTGELYQLYKPGTQFKIGKPQIKLEYSPILTIYTIIEIEKFTNKRPHASATPPRPLAS